ncbi:hypothetical protein P5673_032872 [Acropora cervicornis]|uniref:Tyr recombinase domain-containing protein n=1 Tax=Acropora cervicornis TaxID=6130 RepID=A0AAD9URQ9_ACRCE|nr:hypothetical protein P5673_032872 [Acropora cervicornis]
MEKMDERSNSDVVSGSDLDKMTAGNPEILNFDHRASDHGRPTDLEMIDLSDAEQLLESNKRQKIQDGDEEEDTLLDEIVQSMNETEMTDAKISEKLAKIVANRRLNKLSDGQLKEKTEKYLRPANCDNLKSPKSQTPKYGNDLIAKRVGETLSYRHFGQLPLKESKSLDIEQLIRVHTDALGLLGHMSFEISQRRRDAIRPNLNKEYATLCASHVPITNMLFGDELQIQINHIRASNKICNTTSSRGGNMGYSKQRGSSYRGWHSTSTGRNFLGRTFQTSQQNNRGRNNRNYPLKKKDHNDQNQLCAVKCLQQYMKLTSELRNGADQLWLSYQKPHNPASKDTVSRWIKEFLKISGIDISSYGAHSTRAASSPAASSSLTISHQTIMNAAGWARESTFRKFYDKQADSESPNFGEQLLLQRRSHVPALHKLC